MTSPISRTHSRAFRFRIRSDDAPEPESGPQLPWWAVAVGGALAAAAIGWLVVSGITVLGWLSAGAGDLGDAIALGTQFWLSGNLGYAGIGGETWTMTPLAITIGAGVLIARFAAAAANRRAMTGRHYLAVSLLTGTAYGVVVGGVALAARGGGVAAGTAWLGAWALGVVAAALGALSALPGASPSRWPGWTRALPRAAAAAALVPALAGATLLVIAFATRLDRVAALAEGIGGGPGASVVLFAAQLAYLPNLVVWAGAYALGAGFGLGEGSIVAPSGVQLGLLPGLPVFGAVPDEGVGRLPPAAWLAVGVAAGAMAAVVVLRHRPLAPVGEAAGVSAIAAAAAGLGWLVAGWLSAGDLGTGRLVGLGPRPIELLAFGPGVMVLAAALGGAAWALLRPRLAARRNG